MLKIFSVGTFTQDYYEAIEYLVNSLYLKGQNFNYVYGKMLDNLSYLVFKSGDFMVSIKDPYKE